MQFVYSPSRKTCMPNNVHHHTTSKHDFLIMLLSTLRSNLDMINISDNDLDPLSIALTAMTSSSLFLIVAIAEVATDKVARSVMRSVPRRELRVGDLPKLERLSTAFESDKFLSQGVIPPLWQEDRPEVVVQCRQKDAMEIMLATACLWGWKKDTHIANPTTAYVAYQKLTSPAYWPPAGGYQGMMRR